MKKIIAVHLKNDLSGSPKVLKQCIEGWVEAKKEVVLMTDLTSKGFLSNLHGIKEAHIQYQYHHNVIKKILALFINQWLMMTAILKMASKEDLIYINTVLPFGAALAGRLRRCKVVYHIHETSISPRLFKWFLFFITKMCANKVIYVSQYLANEEPIRKDKLILYNALESLFYERAQNFYKYKLPLKNVLMVCSLKRYKGVDQFVKLSRMNPELNFRLVVNAELTDINAYFTQSNMPVNLKIYPSQEDVHPFYQWADVVVNLSIPDQWVETFGLTVIEAMAYGLPVIVPPVGGISELVFDGENGYKVDSRNVNELSRVLNRILMNNAHYDELSNKANSEAARYAESVFKAKNLNFISK